MHRLISMAAKPESLLIVEENKVIQSLLYETFHRKGYEVSQAFEPREAARLYRENPTSLVVTNIQFGSQNVLDFLYDLKRFDTDVAIIILASDVDLELARQAIAFGIYDLIFIPFELDHVVSTIRKAFEKKMLLERNKHLIERQASLIERLHRSYKQLQELDKLKTEFLVTISHELLTPLTSIKALAYNLLRGIVGPLDPKSREYIQLIQEDTERLEEILRDILNFSKLEAGKIVLHREYIDVQSVIAKIARTLRPVAEDKGLELIHNGQSAATQVWADRSRVEEILANLVENAIKYTPRGGKVELEAEGRIHDVRISVRDTGLGIASEHLDKIFSQFTQFHRRKGPGAQGVGLGLAIVKRLVEMHGGEISVESVLRKGTTFAFTLPKKEPPPPSPVAGRE